MSLHGVLQPFDNFCKDKTRKNGYKQYCRICVKQYREEHKEGIKQYREEHKEGIKQYREEHKEEIKERTKQYREEHKEEIKERNKQYIKERKKNDPVFRLRCLISKHVRDALKKKELKKDHPTWSKIPYTPQQLMDHLEKQFEPWMTWDNHRFI